MSSMPCKIKTTKENILSLKLIDQSPLVLVCRIRDMGLSKSVQMSMLVDLAIVKPCIKVMYILVNQCPGPMIRVRD